MQFNTILFSTSVLLTSLLPLTLAAATQSTSLSTSDIITLSSITQLLSLFSISLDKKDFSALRSVFSPTAALLGNGDPITGIDAIVDFYTTVFQNATLKTEHTSDTVYGYDFTKTTAKSTSYATAVYFGPEILERGGGFFSNTSVVFRERFENEYVKEKGAGWRISSQLLTILSIEGPIEILQPV